MRSCESSSVASHSKRHLKNMRSLAQAVVRDTVERLRQPPGRSNFTSTEAKVVDCLPLIRTAGEELLGLVFFLVVMIYNLYIFDRRGACLFYREWCRPLNTLAEDPEEEKKLMFGMLYSIKGLVAALGSKNAPSSSDGLNHLRTNAYTLHHFETLTGLRFVLNTDNSIVDMRGHLRHIYSACCAEPSVQDRRRRECRPFTPSIRAKFGAVCDKFAGIQIVQEKRRNDLCTAGGYVIVFNTISTQGTLEQSFGLAVRVIDANGEMKMTSK
ncbi:trafficking protein particle complex 1 [Nannochloropsis gaditana]|uniref:Trafficking protein particle complex subunit n=1 Tax=Nannochloropsis gaditana TaxID=72520 RepID=W7U6I1_9STRA|nr:trafficking protein particle complex 1 [Nannochloropsis gaditana]